jgi:hypothetical protein
MINPIFKKAFNEESFIPFIEGFIPDVVINKKRAEPDMVSTQSSKLQKRREVIWIWLYLSQNLIQHLMLV